MAADRPAEVFPPGEFIREELEARGWTQAALAEIIGRPVQMVNSIIVGKKAITPRTATELAAAFGTSPDLWLSLQASYSLSQESRATDDIVARANRFDKKTRKLQRSVRGSRGE